MEAGRQENQDDVTRFWREEREDGAVYSAYLKKVTYRSQAQLEDEHEREFSHLMWETQKIRVIKAGTLEKLVESLSTVRGELDSTYVNIFLATYRTFATPQQVLKLLIDRYQMLKLCCEDDRTELNELQLKTIKSVISVWLDTYPEDFREPPNYPCLHTLEKFSLHFLPDSDLAGRARHRIERLTKDHSGADANEIEFRFSICEEVDHMIDNEYHKPLTFNDISSHTFAQQLTHRDAELFRKVVPHHCLGAVWARRGKKGGKEAASVLATIEQFNRVSLRVIATILKTRDHKTSQRAKIVQKWIHIAQELRELKNFSSLKAIISGLQSHPVYRLRRTWSSLPKDTMVLFEELSEIFSGENNQLNSRELLMKEATAKFPDLDSQNKTLKRRNMQKRQSWIDNGIVQGTVPYLGTFLTDLTMIDTANPDMTEEGLINFEKHRKEFEVLAQLKLLQSAAQIYNFKEDTHFWIWFDSVRVYNDNESHELSCAIEPPMEGSAKIKKKSARAKAKSEPILTCAIKFCSSPSLGHKPAKFDSSKFGLFACGLEDRSSLSSIPDTITASLAGPLVGHLLSEISLARPMMSHSSSTSSVISSDSDTSPSPYRSCDTYVIRVSLEPSDQASTHIYKSIMLCNTDHTNTVIQKVLEKYSLEGQPEDYCLLQILPDGGELLIPERSNVFYALNSSIDLKFVVRTRAEHETLTLRRKGKRRGKKLSL
ncbi:ral guanine nucleotide dissociation stimulator-like isoform X1 [Haliotis rufescens]|uniref:ral guanine nucleotide dissociation stimulator-like isoform X1 n=1 Tax=Haliotis rufescens TaxID=6454 RepID=UPI00201F368C|nr:ral guanine nucleotide dissociation stimulator-like isoform X1 [Haliotis rufescens]